MKIVFTEAEKGSGNYRKIVIDKIKEAFPKKDLGVLINCAVSFFINSSLKSFLKQDVNHLFRHSNIKMKNTLIT